jgi:hypothetical protein
MRRMRARLDAVEAALAARRARKKRVPAPRPSDAVITTRERIWARYLKLEMQFGHGRMKLTRLAFAVKWRLNPSEFCRWFSVTDKRGIPAGSGPDLCFQRALANAIEEFRTKKSRPEAVSLEIAVPTKQVMVRYPVSSQ